MATELATNAIRHGDGSGRLRLWRSGSALYCRVEDDGPGIGDPARAGRRLVSRNAVGGRGLWIVRQLADDCVIESGGTGTSVTVVVCL